MFTQKELIFYQRRCLEFHKDYDMSVHYHPGKENVVAYALSILFMGSVAHVEEKKKGANEGCSWTCLLGSTPYDDIRQRCNSLEWGRIVFGSGG